MSAIEDDVRGKTAFTDEAGQLIDGRCEVYSIDETWHMLLEQQQAMRSQGLRPENLYTRPLKVQLDFTNLCNLRCAFCYNASGPEHHDELSEADLDAICEQLARLEVLEVILSGGEVLCRAERLFGLLDRLQVMRIGVRIVTNGWLVDDRIAATLARYPLCDVQVSIDGADPDIHDAQRGRSGSWRRAVNAVATLSRHELPVSIACILNAHNWTSIGTLVRLGSLLGARRVVFADLVKVGRAASAFDSLYLDDESYEQAYETICQLRSEYQGRLDVSMSTDMGVAMRFNMTLNSTACAIRPNGEVSPSCMIPVVFGDIRREPLDRIWSRLADRHRHPEVVQFVESFRLHHTPRLKLARSVYQERPVSAAGGLP